jgi:hypothetical protein
MGVEKIYGDLVVINIGLRKVSWPGGLYEHES